MTINLPGHDSEPLPTCRKEMSRRGWEQLDVLFISGDAYVDHPAFGVSLLARLLEAAGYRIGVIAQPDLKQPEELQRMGRPRLFAAISAGAMDSMVNHYTAAKKIRHNDAYTPGGKPGLRPDRATIAYTAAVKGAFKGVATVIGGIEASLRRLAHYDYWSDRVRRSILVDSKADLLIYGMAETAILEVTRRLDRGEEMSALRDIRGSAYLSGPEQPLPEHSLLPSFEQVSADTQLYNQAFRLAAEQSNPFSAKSLIQPHGNRQLVVLPPALPLSEEEMDRIYALPFTRQPHPAYREPIPAYLQIRHSITSHRGCFGGCSFCAIASHQGKRIQSRSLASIVKEVDAMSAQPDFNGTISDVGGPTANMYGLACANPAQERTCRRSSCLYPERCRHLQIDNRTNLKLLQQVRNHHKVRHVFVASGIRYDLLPLQPDYYDALLDHHISGLLKVAPETFSDSVSRVMHKPGAAVFTAFLDDYRRRCRAKGRFPGIIPYLISGHPGCTLHDMIEVARYLKHHQLRVEQVQDFTPTPGTLSTCIYYTGSDPFSGSRIEVVRSAKEKRLQKALLLYHRPESHRDIEEALRLCRRTDLLPLLLGSHKPRKAANRSEKNRK
ncbi:YgiQ family radical SAM protein [Pelovirga terrestris]|uniref:YgiQ family radical SAM protein n=1 Tax=Pelovirga terrestris TaxID=2771352 RepID=A0A8J6UHF8_9BACT|nr:YgiQ family radical SAM protein [Pelovirga terrestris]MBD1401383.1 YgiQ family radical SAM protein [Pelovirga terrestris]